MAPGRPGAWMPTPLEVGVFFTVWPLLFSLAVTLALVAAVWAIRIIVYLAAALRRFLP